ncbi:MAG TPA: hypothetical protein VJA46_05820 [Acidimicrobiia bacterium]|nr:hypothetical protein [Acidimicrobiia bacterium]
MPCEPSWTGAPLHFDGWGHYEQARPALSGETIEVVGRWPDQGYTLQYRPALGELVEARQFPIDPFPEVTVLGRIEESGLAELQSLESHGLVDELSDSASRIARPTRTIATEPPVPTGSIIPAHAEIPIYYLPTGGRWLEPGRLIHEDHPSAAYAIAGHWRLRLGAPIGLTPTGLLVFQPPAMDQLRLTIEHPVSQPVGPKLTEGRAGIYRYDGLCGWHQTATVRRLEELQQLIGSLTPSMQDQVDTIRLAIE